MAGTKDWQWDGSEEQTQEEAARQCRKERWQETAEARHREAVEQSKEKQVSSTVLWKKYKEQEQCRAQKAEVVQGIEQGGKAGCHR